MEVIVSHTHTDFDGLAAMVGARKIYPGAVMVLPGIPAKNVQAFISLFKDFLDIRKVSDLDREAITRLILVDTANPARIGPLRNLAEDAAVSVHVYDHHPDTDAVWEPEVKVVEPVGATATIFTEMIRARKIVLQPWEATTLALGIYEDTGSLLFSSTTVRDLEAVTFLLRAGANLGVIAEFVGRPFSEEQKNLFHALMQSCRSLFANRVKVVLATATLPEYVGGLDLIAHRLGEIEGYDVLLVVVRMGERVYIVARSRIDSVPINELLAPFGGGGHARAASAVVKGKSHTDVLSELEAALKEKIQPQCTAAEIMSSPVHTATPEMTVAEAGQMLARFGHTGLPVVEGDRLVGIISRRDLDKARNHGLGHAPIKGYMSRQLVVATPQTTLPRIQQLMIEYDVGRLPVIENNRIVGIVSRTDVLRALHGDNAVLGRKHDLPVPAGPDQGISIPGLLETRLPPAVREALRLAGGAGDQLGVKVYCVGGFVRDLLLGVPNLDVDLAVEGDGLQYAEHLARVGEGDLRIHRRFGTAVVSLPQLKVDVASTRMEYYAHPAALPEIQAATIHQDLYRRDFSINAMAICLNSEQFGELIDFFHGYRDLGRKNLRVLHNLSFVDDPTRLLRAVRFEQRYGFRMDGPTEELARQMVADGFLNTVSGKRLREELIPILEAADPGPALLRLDSLGAWEQLFPGCHLTGSRVDLIDRIEPALLAWSQVFSGRPRRWLVYFLGIVHTLEDEPREEIGKRYHLDRYAIGACAQVGYAVREVVPAILADPDMKNSDLWHLLGGMAPEVLVLTGLKLNNRKLEERMLETARLARTRIPEISGNDLLRLGLKPGPLFQKVFDRIRDARLNGEVVSRQEELDLAARLMNISGEGE